MTSLNPVLSIKRQITEVIKRHLQLSNNEAVKLAMEMLTVVGLPDPIQRINDFPHQFSGGQRQRIMIAMALATNPSLLIADEPTTALDTTIQAQIVDLVKKLQKQFGMAIIWITHDLALITGLVQKIAVMYAGTIVEMTTTRNLYKNTSHPYTLGLLQSLPTTANNIDDEKIRLIPIEGSPPNLLEEPSCCAFAPRCVYAVDKCWQDKPILDLVDAGHYVACWKWEAVRNRV
jgi:oligopeptide/dipeptide ABC transporter ATP-binding protein